MMDYNWIRIYRKRGDHIDINLDTVSRITYSATAEGQGIIALIIYNSSLDEDSTELVGDEAIALRNFMEVNSHPVCFDLQQVVGQ